MRVTEISVTGLFGTFNHSIPLSHADRVTLIHGPNGLGKTMMLKMIAALLDGRTQMFERVPFDEFIACFDDGKKITVRHRAGPFPEDGKRRPKIEISVVDVSGNRLQPTEDEILPDVPRHVLDSIDRHIPGPFSRSGSGWRDGVGDFYSLDEILERFPYAADHLPSKYRASRFASAFDGLEVFFVETTRLSAEKSPPRRISPLFQNEFDFDDDDSQSTQRNRLRVDQYSQDIVQRIKSALADYAKHSQESDRTFPERLVRFVREGESAHEPRKILDQMSKLESKRQRLISLGFLDSESGLRDLTEDDIRRAPEALTIYVGDVQQKLAVFDDLSQRVGKLIDIVNERFKYKSLTLHRDQGFKLKTKSGDQIQLEDLSSGEQHELVVLYELLFRAPRNGLVLVDEPEISLHVAWQSRFLSDLMDILQLTNSYGIVATHSPVIIGTRWDLTQELTGPDEPEAVGV